MKRAAVKTFVALSGISLLAVLLYLSFDVGRTPPPREPVLPRVHHAGAGGKPGPGVRPPEAQPPSSQAFDRKGRRDALRRKLETLLAEGDIEGCVTVLNGMTMGKMKLFLIREFAETASDAQLYELFNANLALDPPVVQELIPRISKATDLRLVTRFAGLHPEAALHVTVAYLRGRGLSQPELEECLDDAGLRHAAICLLAKQTSPLPENVPTHSDLQEPGVAYAMADRLFRDNVDIMEFAKRFPDSPGRNRLLSGYFSKWLSKDAIAASEWIDSCEDPEIALIAAWQVAEFARGHGDAEGAARWDERVARLRAASGK